MLRAARLALGLMAMLASTAPYAQTGGIVNQEEELPQGLAIVPWKKTSAEALEEGPVRLVDEPLRSIDPEVFRRRLGLTPDSEPAATRP